MRFAITRRTTLATVVAGVCLGALSFGGEGLAAPAPGSTVGTGSGPAGQAASPSAAEALLGRSIEFHDAQQRFGREVVQLAWAGTDAEGEPTSSMDMSIHPDGASFEMSGIYRGAAFEYFTDGTTVTALVDGTEPSAETAQRMALSRDGGMFWRDYYGYLAGLPMKLRDPGTIIDPEVISTEFMESDVLAIRVTYSAEVGGDTWYFYFDADTAELVGCRFYHDEAANDGEYIVLEGLVEGDGLRLPQKRSWFTNAEGRYLGGDLIESVAIGR